MNDQNELMTEQEENALYAEGYSSRDIKNECRRRWDKVRKEKLLDLVKFMGCENAATIEGLLIARNEDGVVVWTTHFDTCPLDF